jgi:3-hydroxybutyryl-CoA dehydratase
MEPPFEIGHAISRTLVFTSEDIITGARFLQDSNPLHNDRAVAEASRFGGLIACGPHVSGIHACMLPSHCADQGLRVLGTVFSVRYTGPVLASVSYELNWTVTQVSAHRSVGHFVGWTGTVHTESDQQVCIEATGEVLVTRQEPFR